MASHASLSLSADFRNAGLFTMQPRSSKPPKFCNDFCRFCACRPPEPGTYGRRWIDVMNKDNNGIFGIIVGGVVAAIAAMFILSGGELGGKKTVEGDQDLPPIATVDK
jgi:hypothetical protein